MLFKSTAAAAFLSLISTAAADASVATVYRYVDSTATIYADYCPCPATTPVVIVAPTSGAGSGSSGSGSVVVVPGTGSSGSGTGSSGSGSGTGSSGTGSGSGTGVVVVPGSGSGTGSSGLTPIAGGAPGFQIYISISVGISVGISTTTIVNGGNTVTSVVTTTATVTTPVTVTSPLGGGGAGVQPVQTSAPFSNGTTTTTATASSSLPGGAGLSPIGTTVLPNGQTSTIFGSVTTTTASGSSSSSPSLSVPSVTITTTTSASSSSSSSSSLSVSTTTVTTGTSSSSTSSSSSAVPTLYNIAVSFPAGTANGALQGLAGQLRSDTNDNAPSPGGPFVLSTGSGNDANTVQLTGTYLFSLAIGNPVVTASTATAASSADVVGGQFAYDSVAALTTAGTGFIYVPAGGALPANAVIAQFTVATDDTANDPNNPNNLSTDQGPTPGYTISITAPAGFVLYANGQSQLSIITPANFAALTDPAAYFGGGQTQAFLYAKQVQPAV